MSCVDRSLCTSCVMEHIRVLSAAVQVVRHVLFVCNPVVFIQKPKQQVMLLYVLGSENDLHLYFPLLSYDPVGENKKVRKQ